MVIFGILPILGMTYMFTKDYVGITNCALFVTLLFVSLLFVLLFESAITETENNTHGNENNNSNSDFVVIDVKTLSKE